MCLRGKQEWLNTKTLIFAITGVVYYDSNEQWLEGVFWELTEKYDEVEKVLW